MDFEHGKTRMNVDGDRLSSLPDDLIHKILSFRPIKDAIGTSVLSSRWRYIWISLPYLNFSSADFRTLPEFSRFVNHVLSSRNNLTEVYSVKLYFRGKASQGFLQRILSYAFSHNIQQLNVDVGCVLENNIEFPLSLFSSQSLKHLSLAAKINQRSSIYPGYIITPTSTWELPTLTTLDLHLVTLCDEAAEKCSIFSKCPNLKDLSLKEFTTKGTYSLNIFHPRLSNLTLENASCSVCVVNVVAPQLENLTIRNCQAKHVISAPHLASLVYKGSCPLRLTTKGFNYLEMADICVSHPKDAAAHQIVCLLQQFHNVHFLTLNLEIVEILSSSVDLILPQPSPFVNLKSLKIYPDQWYRHPYKIVTMSTKLKSYLLDGSPGSTFTMVLPKEVHAQKMIAKLLVLLKTNKDNSKTNSDRLEQGTTPAEPKPKKLMIVGAHINNSLENLVVQIEHARFIFTKLQLIEELVSTLPASNRARVQPSYLRLCAEAKIAISKLTDCIKIQCDENQNRSDVYFHELATILEPSS